VAFTSPAIPNSPASGASSTAITRDSLSPSEISKDKIVIGDDLYVGFGYFASMLGVSERTLFRLLANGNGPPRLKIGGSYYYRLDKIPEWAAARGIPLEADIG
jgi:predicted DNA-binding transcriptional regulator AlpA